MRKILLLLVLFFAAKHFAAPSTYSRFLAEEGTVEPTSGETTHTSGEEVVHEAEHEEEGGIELHYSFGTKGFYICVMISIFLTCFAGIMSGLTVGLLSIDTLELEMKMIHGTAEQK